ncbi:MAG: alanine racemase [Mesoaciditoga sp.]|uniref:alanine racemase n=1 Tax=Athalassotoga sp. TaxID=2022597 RepID=UPI000CBB1DE7|nr:MAG: alanine racemase [Mesoaciditoga sp.]PMP80288.1 MAG: alanine racemase [Mesoaciditoga sp.]HEU23630.1 alanine racemase [Mesoaciditoga lauensis]
MNTRNTYAEVNTQNFLRNIFEISKRSHRHVAPVLKADAYGHGAVKMARICQDNGIGFLIVAFLEEAIELRDSGIIIPVLVLNYFDPKYVKEAILRDISVTIFSKDQMMAINEFIGQGRLKVHLNVDTGMGRLGPSIEEAFELYEDISKNTKYILEGLYTHFSSADDPEDPMNLEQINAFQRFTESIKKPKYIHISNSAAATLINPSTGNFSRVGIAAYGLQPSGKQKIDYLRPVMSVHSTVAFVKRISKGRTIGYGHTFVADGPMTVATIPFGYADGLPRSLSNRGEVLVNGKRSKILGRVSMDQIVVDVSQVENVNIGDDVVIIGKSGDEEITVEEIARLDGTINYEIVCGISKRVPRIYI